MSRYSNITLLDRIIAVATYLSAGGAGFIWFIVCVLMKKTVSSFLTYHIMQSIFISILYFLVVKLCQMVFIILYKIPLINAIPYYLNMPLPIFFGLSIIQAITSSVIIYLCLTSFLGMFSYIPWVSDIINQNTGRK